MLQNLSLRWITIAKMFSLPKPGLSWGLVSLCKLLSLSIIPSLAHVLLQFFYQRHIWHPFQGMCIELQLFYNTIFLQNLQRPLDHDFFTVVKYITDTNIKSVSFDNLRDELLQEAISSVADSDYKVCQITLNNISTYVEVVHHQGYSAELMQSKYRLPP